MNRASLDYIMCKTLDDYPPKKWFQWDVFCLKIRYIIFQLALYLTTMVNTEVSMECGKQTRRIGSLCNMHMSHVSSIRVKFQFFSKMSTPNKTLNI